MAYNQENTDEKVNRASVHDLAAGFAKFIPILAGNMGMKMTRFFTADVTALSQEDEDNRVCSVKGILDNEEIEYTDVNLSMERNDGIIEVPAIGSTVLVGKMPDGELYIVKCSDISRWIVYIDGSNSLVFDSNGFVFNGGLNDGLVKINSLITKLNAVETRDNDIVLALTALATACNAAGAVPLTGTALGGLITTAIASIITPLSLTVKANLENPKIKH